MSLPKFQNWGAGVKTMLPEDRTHTATLLLLVTGAMKRICILVTTGNKSFFSTKLTISDLKEKSYLTENSHLFLEQKNYCYSKKTSFQMMRRYQYSTCEKVCRGNECVIIQIHLSLWTKIWLQWHWKIKEYYANERKVWLLHFHKSFIYGGFVYVSKKLLFRLYFVFPATQKALRKQPPMWPMRISYSPINI